LTIYYFELGEYWNCHIVAAGGKEGLLYGDQGKPRMFKHYRTSWGFEEDLYTSL
jgi:hypothetical protein